jgi:hypothetical protein
MALYDLQTVAFGFEKCNKDSRNRAPPKNGVQARPPPPRANTKGAVPLRQSHQGLLVEEHYISERVQSGRILTRQF